MWRARTASQREAVLVSNSLNYAASTGISSISTQAVRMRRSALAGLPVLFPHASRKPVRQTLVQWGGRVYSLLDPLNPEWEWALRFQG